MSVHPSVEDARTILGPDLVGPAELEHALGTAPIAASIPFSRDQIVAAKDVGALLVLRLDTLPGEAPLTIMEMVRRFPDAFDQRLLRQMGYQLKDDWGIELEPLAGIETCTFGWAFASKEVLDETRNLTYDEQEPAVRRYAQRVGAAPTDIRRRAAVEAVYDTLVYFVARRVRLLQRSWDWSGSRTVDGGYLNVGGFGEQGIQVLSFSGAIRHGGLGVCPTWQPTS